MTDEAQLSSAEKQLAELTAQTEPEIADAKRLPAVSRAEGSVRIGVAGRGE